MTSSQTFVSCRRYSSVSSIGFTAFLRSRLSARDSPATSPHTSVLISGFLLRALASVECQPLHATVLYLPLVISRLANFVLATNILYRPSCFHCFQDPNDLMFTKFALLHFGLLASYSPGNLYFSMVWFLGRVIHRDYPVRRFDRRANSLGNISRG
jgi:hypothetical protein